jgi:transcriptional regulator with XRE-family HTH domain
MKQEIVQSFGERIKAIRNELKLTQKEFAAKIEVAPSYISEQENGKMGAGFDFLFKLSFHYNINPFYLFHGRGPRFLSAEFEHETTQSKSPLLKDVEVKKLLKWMAHSALFKLEVLSFSTRFLIENMAVLKDEGKFKEEDPFG